MARSRTTAPAWQPGQSANPVGRAVGSRSKLSEKFILALHDDFVQHGQAVITRVRTEFPQVYLQVIGRLVPRELHLKNESPVAGMTDEHLHEALANVRSQLAARAPAGTDLGAPAAGGNDKLN
jgi:hypothetical protein